MRMNLLLLTAVHVCLLADCDVLENQHQAVVVMMVHEQFFNH